MPSGQRVGGGIGEQSTVEAKTVILIDDGRERLMVDLVDRGYGVVHLAAKDASSDMLVCLIGNMSFSRRRRTALVADVPRKEADEVAAAIWELFPGTRVVIVDKEVKQIQIGIDRRCDMVVPCNIIEILAVLEGYATAEVTPQKEVV